MLDLHFEEDTPYAPGVGPLLISLRETLHVTAGQLGEALGVTETEVLQAELCNYQGLPTDEVRRILATLQDLGRRPRPAH